MSLTLRVLMDYGIRKIEFEKEICGPSKRLRALTGDVM